MDLTQPRPPASKYIKNISKKLGNDGNILKMSYY